MDGLQTSPCTEGQTGTKFKALKWFPQYSKSTLSFQWTWNQLHSLLSDKKNLAVLLQGRAIASQCILVHSHLYLELSTCDRMAKTQVKPMYEQGLTVNIWFNLLKLLLSLFFCFFTLSLPCLLFNNIPPTITTMSWILRWKKVGWPHTFHMKENYFPTTKKSFCSPNCELIF